MNAAGRKIVVGLVCAAGGVACSSGSRVEQAQEGTSEASGGSVFGGGDPWLESSTGGGAWAPDTGGSTSVTDGTGGASDGNDGVGGQSEGRGGRDSGPPTCQLSASPPLQTSEDGQVIENLHIVSGGGSAIQVDHEGVVIRNVWIEHSGGKGIVVNGDDAFIENVHVQFTSAPESGPNSAATFINIECNGANGLRVDGARLELGSSGIYLVNCPDSHLSYIEGHDFRGPYPRGQVVQWNASDRGILEDFSVISPPGSWPEDNVNVYKSTGALIRRGLVDGNNAPSGVGVIFDGGTSTGLVEDVDAVHMGNGCFSGYAGGEDVTFSRTRCRDNFCTGQDGREASKSNSLMWAGSPERTMQRILDSTYTASCNGNISWPASAFSDKEIEEQDFTLRAPIELSFCWE